MWGRCLDANGYLADNVEHMSIDLLGTFEQLTLMALLRLGDEAYGRSLHEELESRLGKSIALGQVYVTLSRLEEKGFVRSSTGEASPVRGGRAKRHFSVTGKGVRALNDSARALVSMGMLTLAGARTR
jgi:PadR family transcriptional regulator